MLALCGVFFVFFALNRGGVATFVDVCAGFFILNTLTGKYNIKKIPIPYVVVLAICAYLILASLIVSPQDSHTRWIENIVRFLIIIFTIHCLSCKQLDRRDMVFMAGVPVLAVCWQFAAFHFFKMPHGTFTNIHYLGGFTAFVLPILVSFCLIVKWPKKIFLLVPILLNIDLLLRTGSRPPMLGLILGTLFVAVFLIKDRYKWYSFGLIFIALACIYFTNYGGMQTRIDNLILNASKEERPQIYRNAWLKLKQNTPTNWLVGHGINEFSVSFTMTNKRIRHFVFPHNHLLEVIYLNGFFGLILIYSGWGVLLFRIIKMGRTTESKTISQFSKSLLISTIVWMLHCGLTYPIFSKYSLYPLAFLLGSMLLLLELNPDPDNPDAQVNF